MALPNKCSYSSKKIRCIIPPSYIISIQSNNEFLVGMSCEDHYAFMKRKIELLQKTNLLPKGKINIQNIRMISTNCIKGTKEDYEEVISQREIEF